MASFLYELQRTVATMTLLPWMVVRSPSPAASIIYAPSTRMEDESLRWVVIQILVLYAFYRLITPLITSQKVRAYSKARMAMDAWLFSSLAIHTPALSANFNPRPTRLFASVFALFLVASHVTLAIFTLTWHIVGWITRTFWPNLVDTLWLPSGKTWKSPSMGNLIRFSLILSLSTSLVFVGCTIEAQQADNTTDLPLICQGGWYSKTREQEDGTMIYKNLGYLKYLGQLSLLNSPVGLLWLSGLALWVIYYTSRRSSRLALRARIKEATRMEDVLSRADALWQTEVEEGFGLPQSLSKQPPEEKPEFLEMCEWYSVATVDTAVQLLISLKLFFGRFDLRLLKRPTFGTFVRVSVGDPFVSRISALTSDNGRNENGEVKNEPKPEENLDDNDFFFDWMADTGDGGHSTYQVARWLAKPVLYIRKDATCLNLLKGDAKTAREIGDIVLPRGRLLLIGGDLAYPDPSIENLDKRLFQPFCDAMEPPSSYRKDYVSIEKDDNNPLQPAEEVIPLSSATSAPVCYCLAGNHDHFDGLHAFYRCIVDRDWLGGWRLPQTASYFTIKLTHGWWIFALDQALGEDIDSTQFRYFEHMANHVVGPNDRIIVASHEPIWLYDAYCEKVISEEASEYSRRAPLVKELLKNHLGKKVALRISGDLHNYMRYQEESPYKPENERLNLVVSGGGGAFLHPTHSFPATLKEDLRSFKLQNCYPDVATSRMLGFENLGSGFRVHNWRFDFVGASIYFFICVSLFPRCGVKARVVDASLDGLNSYFVNYFYELVGMIRDAFSYGYISPVTMILVMLITIGFAEGEKGFSFQLRLGFAHGLAHIVFALTALMLFQITVETAIVDGLAGTSFYSLFESYLETERGAVPRSAWTDATFLSIIREILRAFDMPESVAVPHAFMCREALSGRYSNTTSPATSIPPPESLSRLDMVWFYFASYSYLYVLSADLVALVIGIYLAVSSSILFVHWNESFSSLRHRHLKNFVRFRIDAVTGDLHAFVLGIDRVPQNWTLNPNYETTMQRMQRTKVYNEFDPRVASFTASSPSKWLPSKRRDLLQSKPRLVDYFVVKKASSTETTPNVSIVVESLEKVERQKSGRSF